LESASKLTTDGGIVRTGIPYTDPETGRIGQSMAFPEDTPDQNGAVLELTCPGYLDMRVRGFFVLDPDTSIARLQVDDYTLTPIPEPPPEEPTDPNLNPIDVIHYVYNSGSYDLETKEGCGQFTEACCTELHTKMHKGWGHVKKNPGQNQYNGHAVDAIMLLVASGGTAPGIYDIILSTESPDAAPAFNYAGPVDSNLWYYPAAPVTSATLAESIARGKESYK
jgi:hypothetical protein